jgi:hypothetical protein
MGLAWTPFGSQATVLRGGFGLFFDRVPLNVYSFVGYPEAIITTFRSDGTVIDGPRHFYNVTATTLAKRPVFIQSENEPGNFAPYSATWNIEIEQPITHRLRVRVNYLQGNSYGLVILDPGMIKTDTGMQSAYILNGGGRARYRQLELTARLPLRAKQEIFFSYVRSRSRGDLNEFNRYLGNFPSPLIRNNVVTNLSGDLPHRVVSWGLFKLPKKIGISPLIEYRTGFPYAVTNAYQDYVGMPNADTTRFPPFFSLDVRVSKDFQVKPKYAVRFTLRGQNLTNHFNPLGVHSNIADPMYGIFFGNYKRRYTVDLDVLY